MNKKLIHKPVKKEEINMHRVDERSESLIAATSERINAILSDSQNEQPAMVYIRAATLGFATGIRSMTPLALLSWTSDKSHSSIISPSQLLTTFAALGEAVADKFPAIPSRTRPGPFVGRMVIGGLGGLVLCRREHFSPVLGFITGASGAAIGAIASTYSRKKLTEVTKIPDPVWGVLEDMLASGLGFLAVRKKM